jgi:hypothetical protein
MPLRGAPGADENNATLPNGMSMRADGYVRLALGSRGASEYVHRIVCWLVWGPPTQHDKVCSHLCGHPNCVNPHHLRWVSEATNQRMRRFHDQPDRRGKLYELSRERDPEEFSTAAGAGRKMMKKPNAGKKGKNKRGRPRSKMQ